MGLFKDAKGFSQQQDRLLQLKSDLVATEYWSNLYESPLFGSGIRIGFAAVDCRLCGKTDAGLLLDQTIWDWQTHKVSYSNCLLNTTSWLAENQGPQRPKSKAAWLESDWSIFDENLGTFTNMQGNLSISSGADQSLESWIISNFLDKGFEIKKILTKLIRGSEMQERIRQLEEHIKTENLEI